jgi:hypothetical protein
MFALLQRPQNRHPRAPRFSIPHKEKVVVTIDSSRVAGLICRLSVNGGTLRLPQRLNAGTLAGVSLKTDAGVVEGAIQFLGVVDDLMDIQAFRFVHMAPADRQTLQAALQRMHQQGLATADSGFGQRTLGRVRNALDGVKRMALRLSEAASLGLTRG